MKYLDTSNWSAEKHITRLRKICGTWRCVGSHEAEAQLVEDAAKYIMKLQEAAQLVVDHQGGLPLDIDALEKVIEGSE